MIVTDKIYQKNEELSLYKTCDPVDFKTEADEAKEIVEQLHKTIDEYNALGVAANQIGVTKAIFSVATQSGFKDFINPEIIEYSDDWEVFEEGCLSFPNLFVKIKRAKQVKVKFQDIEGAEHVEIFNGLFARVIQHESDHLAGRRFFDAANRIHFDAAMRKYKSQLRKLKNTI